MYKKFDVQELLSYQTHFFHKLKQLMTQEKTDKLSAFLKSIFRYGHEVYYFDGNEPVFRILKQSDTDYIFYDEQERIHLICDSQAVNQVHNILKNLKAPASHKHNMLDSLIAEFIAGSYRDIEGKPYLVYDIETPIATNDLSKLPFALAYVSLSSQTKDSFQASYIDKENLKKFVDFTLSFEGYIVGYNNIGFDNPVIAYNIGYTQTEIDIINAKSLDLFQVMYNLTGKRIGLNKLSTALIGLKKTLGGGGAEGSVLLKQRSEHGDEKALAKVKEYCKNDVKMTLGVLLYLLKFGKIQTEEGEYVFDHQQLIKLGQLMSSEQYSSTPISSTNMFGM